MTPEGGLSRMVTIWSRRPNVRTVKGTGILFPGVFPRLFATSGEMGLQERRPDQSAGSEIRADIGTPKNPKAGKKDAMGDGT